MPSSIEDFSTFFPQNIGNNNGPMSPAIVSSAAFNYESCEEAEAIFKGEKAKPLYSRMGNPTTAKLEQLLSKMDGGVGAIATSSGMAAVTLSILSFANNGDEIICVGGLFGGSYALFSQTLSRYGITAKFFDVDEIENIENAINDKTKVIFCESVGNPNLKLPNLQAIADIANKHRIISIVDNTITPIIVKPINLGIDIVVYSTTKIINGNASNLGGAVVFRAVNEGEDKLKTERYKFLKPFIQNLGKMALIGNGKKRVMRDFGFSANAQSSYTTMLGLETLPLRTERVNSSVEKVANALNDAGLNVRHPSISSHEHHSRYKEQFSQGCGTMMTIDCEDKEKAFKFLNSSNLIKLTANIGDSRTLGLHMDSTIYRDFNEEEKSFLGITPGLIRISIGLENPEDIINDFKNAWESIQ